jgi:hypothetical protein
VSSYTIENDGKKILRHLASILIVDARDSTCVCALQTELPSRRFSAQVLEIESTERKSREMLETALISVRKYSVGD